MNVAFDPKLIDHLELREKALKEHDARALYQMAQIYASMKGKKNEKKAYELYKSSATHGYAKARFMMGAVQRERDWSQAKPSNGDYLVYTGGDQRRQ